MSADHSADRPAGHAGRERLALALDVGAWDVAEPLVTRLRPWFGIAKVGLELYAEAGPDVVGRLHDLDVRVFADLKLYDIPNTVERAARALARRGVDFLNFAAVGGVEMVAAGVRGLGDGARDRGLAPPIALAVTVLTSEHETTAFADRLAVAVESGCQGAVCSAHEVAAVRERGLRTMVPGVRFADDDTDDQARVATPGDAIARGADWLVVGRPVTLASHPEAAAAAVADAVVAAR